jgi:hypothetical protein
MKITTRTWYTYMEPGRTIASSSPFDKVNTFSAWDLTGFSTNVYYLDLLTIASEDVLDDNLLGRVARPWILTPYTLTDTLLTTYIEVLPESGVLHRRDIATLNKLGGVMLNEHSVMSIWAKEDVIDYLIDPVAAAETYLSTPNRLDTASSIIIQGRLNIVGGMRLNTSSKLNVKFAANTVYAY